MTTGTPVTPDATTILTSDDIRRFLRDYAENNLLLDNEIQFSDTDIAAAIRFITAKYNAITPITNLAATDINEYILLIGVSAHLLTSEGARQLRNQLTWQDGEINPLGIDDKYRNYLEFAGTLKSEFEQKAQAIKAQMYLESAYGSLASGYSGYIYD